MIQEQQHTELSSMQAQTGLQGLWGLTLYKTQWLMYHVREPYGLLI